MNSDLPSAESVTDNLENIPEVKVTLFHEGFSSAFLLVLVYLMILQFVVFCQVFIYSKPESKRSLWKTQNTSPPLARIVSSPFYNV